MIERRLATRTTGAEWQRRVVAAAEPDLGRDGALTRMLAELTAHGIQGPPLA